MSEENGLWLNKIKGVSTSDGIRYTGSEDAYLKFLRTFASSIDRKSDEIENSYKNGDMEFCTIKVHALKSTARIIGAKELSKLAEQMENAGRVRNMEFFDANIDKILEMYRSYKDNLKDLPKEDMTVERTPISESELKEAYQALLEYAEAMDYEAVKMIISEMGVYILPDEYADIFETVNRKLLDFDWDGIHKALGIE